MAVSVGRKGNRMAGNSWKATVAGLLIALAFGCQRAPEEASRTYSEETDGTPAVADSSPSAEPMDVAIASPKPDGPMMPGDATAASSPDEPSKETAKSDSDAVPPTNSTVASASQPASATTASQTPAADSPTEPAAMSLAEAAILAQRSGLAPGELRLAPKVKGEPLKIELLIPEKQFLHVPPGNALRVSYDDLDLLKVLNMEPVPADCVNYFPDWLKSLDGQRIRIRGFMYPPLRETGLTGFVLARDNQICCFGRFPKIYDVFPVTLAEGTTVDYIPNRPFDVVGRFHIRPDVYRGELENLYEIEEAQVITN